MDESDAEQKAATAAGPPIAGLGRRLAAMAYDSLVLFGVLFIASAIYQQAVILLGLAGAPAAVHTGDTIYSIEPAASGPLFQLYLVVVSCGFYVLFWTRSGQTLGMIAWRLRVQRADGSNPGAGQCVVRLAAAVLSWACLGAGYWWLLFDPDRRTWHDRLSHSDVVVLPKRRRPA